MVVYVCPRCWCEIDVKVYVCPHCASALAEHEALPYEEKLLNALSHRVRDYRTVAIRILARMKSPSAPAAFEALLKDEQDVYVIREAVRALVTMDTPDSQDALKRLSAHPSEFVRQLARQSSCGGPLQG